MDNQGHQKDKFEQYNGQNSVGISVNNHNPIDYFAQDRSFVFVYKKTEKLATALYMVTNLFNDTEPMKWTLRAKVSELLSFIIGFKDVLESREYEFSNEVKTKVLEIVSLLEVASQSGLVSPMNFSILKTEFMNLIGGLIPLKKQTEERDRFALPKTFFDVPQGSTYTPTHVPNAGGVDTQHKGQHTIKDTTVPSETANEITSFKKTNRQSIIINLLKKKKDLTIKDIAQVIRDCSEKTIQRELISLIDAGVLKKTGERRWSRYSLVA